MPGHDWKVIDGDCVEQMAMMDEASVDAICTDPPYLIGFMGKEFDSQHKTFVERKSNRRAGSFEAEHGNHNPVDSSDQQRTRLAEGRRAQEWHEAWARQALRVLKPGGHLLAFGGTRTYHRLACAIEDAGFEIRDRIECANGSVVLCPDGSLAWYYGSGFPKSLDAERAVAVQTCRLPGRHFATTLPREDQREPGDHVCPVTPESAPWEGWGTALKPAHEPIVVARKPLAGTVAGNVLAHGTGALNVDGCRIEGDVPQVTQGAEDRVYGNGNGLRSEPMLSQPHPAGRWPPNVCLSESAAAALDEQTGPLHSQDPRTRNSPSPRSGVIGFADGGLNYADSGGASRFFLTAGFSTMDAWPLPGDASTTDASMSAGKRTASSDDDSLTVGSGNRPTDQSRPDTKSTTGTTTRSITTSATSNSESPASTSDTTAHCEPLRSSATDSGDAPGAASGSLSTPSPPARTLHDSPTAGTADASTCASGASETASTTTLTTGSTGPSDSSRWFYCAKSSSAERNAGLDGFEAKPGLEERLRPLSDPRMDREQLRHPKANHHPTVKPIALMRWLIRLVTPPGGLVLDPFAGSGTTGCAAQLEGFRFVGIERDPEYTTIARARIAWWAGHPEGMELVQRLEAERQRKAVVESGQLGLFG